MANSHARMRLDKITHSSGLHADINTKANALSRKILQAADTFVLNPPLSSGVFLALAKKHTEQEIQHLHKAIQSQEFLLRELEKKL